MNNVFVALFLACIGVFDDNPLNPPIKVHMPLECALGAIKVGAPLFTSPPKYLILQDCPLTTDAEVELLIGT